MEPSGRFVMQRQRCAGARARGEQVREAVAGWLQQATRAVREAREAVHQGRRGARQRYARALTEADVAQLVAETLLTWPLRRIPQA